MEERQFDNLSTHDKLKALNRDQLALIEQVRKVAEKIDRHLKAERRARAAYSATFITNTDDHKVV